MSWRAVFRGWQLASARGQQLAVYREIEERELHKDLAIHNYLEVGPEQTRLAHKSEMESLRMAVELPQRLGTKRS